MAVTYTTHLHATLENIWRKINLPKKVPKQKNQEPNESDKHCYLSVSKKTACSLGKCVLSDQILAIHQDGKSLFCAQLQTVVKGKKVPRNSYCWYVLLYLWQWKFKLNFVWSSKPAFQEINEKLMWLTDTMLKFIKKFQDGSQNARWNLCVKVVKMNIIFLALHLCGKSQSKFQHS